MRTLLLLRGVPASGKSTFIRENHLEPYTLCADDFRLKISNPVLTETGKFGISQKHDAEAWHLLYDALEARMRRGDFTVIDATNISPKMLAHYKKFLNQYRYTAFYLDIDVTLEEALRRNAAREEYKRVPEPEIRRMHAMKENVGVPSYVKKIEKLDDIMNYFTPDLTGQYERVMVFGDVHGCYSALRELLPEQLDERTKYIFSGDMLERGLENREVLDFVLAHCRDKNVTFVMGNHDQWMLEWATDSMEKDKKGRTHEPRSFDKMITELTKGVNSLELEKMKKEIREAFRRFVQAYPFSFHGKKYFVCHGGLPSVPQMTLISANELMRGVGSYEFPIDNMYETNYALHRTQDFVQIHGHRCASQYDAESYDGLEHSVSLDGHVEVGGSLKACVIEPDGFHVIRAKNTVFDTGLADDVEQAQSDSAKDGLTTENELTNKMLESPDIRVKIQSDHNLMSLNFTDMAFYKQHWNEQTIHARGLFVDRKSGMVKMRSYNKFFNLGERPETEPEALERSLVFPLAVYRKQNGFLGIMSVVDGDVVLASKTQTGGQYAGYFKEIYATLADKEKAALKDMAQKYDCSFVFEVCHVKDRHIIDFDKNHLWLLDAIPNRYAIGGQDVNRKFSDDIKAQIPLVSGVMKKKELLFIAHSIYDVTAYAEIHRHDRDIEGVVCQDERGYMFKIKFHYYTTMKKLRSSFQLAQRRFSSGLPWGAFRDERTIKFISFFSKRPYKEWRNMHIIDAIKLYEKESGELIMAKD